MCETEARLWRKRFVSAARYSYTPLYCTVHYTTVYIYTYKTASYYNYIIHKITQYILYIYTTLHFILHSIQYKYTIPTL